MTQTPLAAAEAFAADLAAECDELRAQLAASQASEARLREVLDRCALSLEMALENTPNWAEACFEDQQRAREALNATASNPLTAVVEAALAWAEWRHNAFVTVKTDTEGDLLRAIATLDKGQTGE